MELSSKLNDLFLQWTVRWGSRCLTTGSGKLPMDLVPSRSTKASSTWPRITWRRRKRHTCPCQGVRRGINGRLGGLRKALFRRKGDEARNYDFAFIGVVKGTVTPRTVGERGRRASGLLGITAGILEHMLSALCSREALDESYRLLDRPENMRMALLSIRATVFCTQITARRDDRRRS